MGNNLLKDLNKLVSEGVITDDIASNIKKYYVREDSKSGNNLQVILAVLGSLLVGLGILLILAHNWDGLSKVIKSVLAFTPLVIAQAMTVFVLLKKKNSKMWREGVGVFIFLAVAISISLVSQIYHINGEFSSFMLTWMILVLPMIYILDSSMVSLLYIIGITVYVANVKVFKYDSFANSLVYVPLIIFVFPHYYNLLTKSKYSNFTYFHNWIIPLSLLFSVPMMVKGESEFIPLLFLSVLTIIYFVGKSKYLAYDNLIKNAYSIIGVLGMLIFMYVVSFDNYWSSLVNKDIFKEINYNLFLSAVVFIIAFSTSMKLIFGKYKFDPIDWGYILFIILFFIFILIEFNPFFAVLLINIYILFVGIFYIKKGESHNDLISLNLGLLTIAILILVRFFDYDISFLIRGLLFILIGVGFFVANYLMIKKRDKKISIH